MILRAQSSKKLLIDIASAGALVLAVVDPTLITPAVVFAREWKKQSKEQKKRLENSFYGARRKGYINFESRDGRTYIELTEKGRQQMALLTLFDNTVPQKKRWDGKWRILIFDISSKEKTKRDALRLFIRRIGFVQLQKSVWVYPYNCQKEFELLRDFFTLPQEACRLITATEIGDTKKLRKGFKL